MEKAASGLNWTFLISEDGHIKTPRRARSRAQDTLVVSVGGGTFAHQKINSRVGAGLSVGCQRWVGGVGVKKVIQHRHNTESEGPSACF